MKNRKLRIKLNPLEKTVINTKTQEEYDTLMLVYELGGWVWLSGRNPTEKKVYWEKYKEKTGIDAGISDLEGKRKFGFYNLFNGIKYKVKIISPEEFYKIQRIDEKTLNELREI